MIPFMYCFRCIVLPGKGKVPEPSQIYKPNAPHARSHVKPVAKLRPKRPHSINEKVSVKVITFG